MPSSELVRRYQSEHGVPADAIGVVSPFRAQVVLLRKLLQDTGVTVDTVERFQGGERDIMILSLVRSRAAGLFLTTAASMSPLRAPGASWCLSRIPNCLAIPGTNGSPRLPKLSRPLARSESGRAIAGRRACVERRHAG